MIYVHFYDINIEVCFQQEALLLPIHIPIYILLLSLEK